jgi:hypothetical protein
MAKLKHSHAIQLCVCACQCEQEFVCARNFCAKQTRVPMLRRQEFLANKISIIIFRFKSVYREKKIVQIIFIKMAQNVGENLRIVVIC